MAFTIKTRGAGGPMLAEYLCSEHGRFEALVDRDENGDPPPEQRCEALIAELPPDVRFDERYICGERSAFAISAPKPKVLSVPCYAAVRGKDDERRPGQLDTRALAEGMPMSEWKQAQRKQADERRHQKLIERGLKTKRVQVG